MRILTIGDIHGRKIWKKFADINFLLYAEDGAAGYGGFVPEYDYYVFLGDYVDSFTETNITIAENLLEIIKFKKLYTNNVILLWGNHDLAYFLNEPWKKIKYNITGFRPEAHYDLYEIFNLNKELFQLAFQLKNYVWTHAGIHKGWYDFVFKRKIKNTEFEKLNIAEQLNLAFDYRIECLFDVDWYRGGNKKTGGPIWCDKTLTYNKPLRNINQIVGHTAVKGIKTYRKDKNTTITYCDVLNTENNFYELNIND